MKVKLIFLQAHVITAKKKKKNAMSSQYVTTDKNTSIRQLHSALNVYTPNTLSTACTSSDLVNYLLIFI
jgi:hypothetical protein